MPERIRPAWRCCPDPREASERGGWSAIRWIAGGRIADQVARA